MVLESLRIVPHHPLHRLWLPYPGPPLHFGAMESVLRCRQFQSHMCNQRELETASCVSMLDILDLATDSEPVRQARTHGTSLQEGSHINKSLLVLGRYIEKLSNSRLEAAPAAPFRVSKHTRILRRVLQKRNIEYSCILDMMVLCCLCVSMYSIRICMYVFYLSIYLYITLF
jgi:hypothetical protein